MQSPIATQFIESLTTEDPGFISIVVTVETTWVLSRAYKLTREQVVKVLEALVRSREIIVAEAADVVCALHVYKSGSADFADCLIERLANQAGSSETVTFDSSAAKNSGMTLLESG